MNRRLSLAALFALAVGLAAACSGSAAAPTMAPTTAPTAAPLPAATSAPGAGNPQTGSSGSNAIPGQPQLIVYTGSLHLEVADVDSAVNSAGSLITGLGGHLADSTGSDSGNGKSADVTYRIPAERWADALTGLKALATRVIGEQTSSSDVTGQVVDLNARIANEQSSELALQAIMAKATTITDILKVQDELTQVQGDIESMTAQRDLLSNQAALATLEVSFTLPVPPPVPQAVQAAKGWDLGSEIDSAVAALVRILQSLTSVLVWLVIVVLPTVGPVVVVMWIGYRLYLRWRRTHPVAVPQAAGPGQWPPSM